MSAPDSGSFESRRLSESELIINPEDKSIYHLKIRPEHLADNVIVVGDPKRVVDISSHFTHLEAAISNREFVTHTGTVNGKRISVIGTGIGTDNIDIVFNEIDAVANIDFNSRTIVPEPRSLNVIRIGTTGSVQPDIPVGTFLASEYGMGMDGLLHYYNYTRDAEEQALEAALGRDIDWPKGAAKPYAIKASSQLMEAIAPDMEKGITATASGFYGPQGRSLRLPLGAPELNRQLMEFRHEHLRVTNFEMETSALYGLGKLMGHNCVTVCVVIANRIRNEYDKDYKSSVRKLIDIVLDRIPE